VTAAKLFGRWRRNMLAEPALFGLNVLPTFGLGSFP